MPNHDLFRLSRRGLLAVGAASLAAGLPVAARAADGKAGAYDVIVVGAGFAGAAAARDIAKAGHRVLLIEARNRIGGRTFTASLAGKKVEMGGTWIHWSQPFVWAEIERYGLGLTESPGAAPEHTALLSEGILKQAPAEQSWPILAEAMAKFCDIDGVGGRTVFPRAHDPFFHFDAVKQYDRLSLRDRLDEMRFPAEARDLVATQLAINCHNDPRQGGFVDQLKWWSLGDFDMGRLFDKLGRYKIAEGTGALIKAMVEDAGCDLRLSTSVTEVRVEGGRAEVVTAGGEVLSARAVVMAVPMNVLKTIAFTPALSAGKLAASTEGHAGSGSKCYVHIKEKIGKWMGQAPYPHPITIAWTEQERDDGTLLVAFGPPKALDIGNDRAVEQALRNLLPGATVLSVVGYQWDADPYSRGTWCWYRPNQLTRYQQELREPAGQLFFASADWAKGWRGFIDGAIESGIGAARDVRASLAA